MTVMASAQHVSSSTTIVWTCIIVITVAGANFEQTISIVKERPYLIPMSRLKDGDGIGN